MARSTAKKVRVPVGWADGIGGNISVLSSENSVTFRTDRTALWPTGKASDFRLREPGFESCTAV